MSADFQTYDDAHVYADTDKGPNSIHHTLGNQPQQASPGDHDHDKSYSALGHAHTEADVTSLVGDLAGKSPVGHTHVEGDVNSLVADLAGKAASNHGHLKIDWWHISNNTGGADAGKWTPIAKFDLLAQYDDSVFEAIISSYGSGSPTGQFAHIRARVKQQNPLGSLVSTSLFVWDNYGCSNSDFYLEVRSNTAGECYGYLWARIPAGYDALSTVCVYNSGNRGWLQTNDSGLYAAPAGMAGSTYATYLQDTTIPTFKAIANALQTFTTGVWAQVVFATEQYDDSASFAGSTFTAPVAGDYHFDASVEWVSAAGGYRVAAFAVNGTRIPGRDGFPGAAVIAQANQVSTDVRLAAGDQVTVWAVQNTGANLNTAYAAPDSICSFNGHLVRRT